MAVEQVSSQNGRRLVLLLQSSYSSTDGTDQLDFDGRSQRRVSLDLSEFSICVRCEI
jgi:hypothetical protein